MESLIKQGIKPDFKLLNKVLKYSILRCNQCETYQLYNGKCFEDLTEKQIPAIIDWELSIKVYEAIKQEISPIMQKPFMGPAYGGICNIKTNDNKTFKNVMVFVSPHPLSGEGYDPLYLSSNICEIDVIKPIINHQTYIKMHEIKTPVYCIRCPWEDTHWYHKQKEWIAN